MAMLNNQMVINFGYRLTHCFIASLRSYQTMKNGMWSRGSQFDGISELPLGHMVSSKSYRLYRCLCLIFFGLAKFVFLMVSKSNRHNHAIVQAPLKKSVAFAGAVEVHNSCTLVAVKVWHQVLTVRSRRCPSEVTHKVRHLRRWNFSTCQTRAM